MGPYRSNEASPLRQTRRADLKVYERDLDHVTVGLYNEHNVLVGELECRGTEDEKIPASGFLGYVELGKNTHHPNFILRSGDDTLKEKMSEAYKCGFFVFYKDGKSNVLPWTCFSRAVEIKREKRPVKFEWIHSDS